MRNFATVIALVALLVALIANVATTTETRRAVRRDRAEGARQDAALRAETRRAIKRDRAQSARQEVALRASRIESCRQTYEGIRKVFKPFLPPVKHRTAEQASNVGKFNRTIDHLKAGCRTQVTARPAR